VRVGHCQAFKRETPVASAAGVFLCADFVVGLAMAVD